MKNIGTYLILGLLVSLCSLAKGQSSKAVYESENLIIHKLSDHVYQHITYLQTESFGKVPCNGTIVTDDAEAIVFDSPADKESAEELINWITKKLDCKVKAVVPTHFHVDCVGGLAAFHQHGIPSHALNQTIELAKKNGFPQPQNGFADRLELSVGNEKVVAEFLGEGHTKDNIIAYFPKEKILFGGCLVKEMGAGKGNLEDANLNDWPETIKKIKLKYPQTKTVIPGHGKSGGMELLDYTIKLFGE